MKFTVLLAPLLIELSPLLIFLLPDPYSELILRNFILIRSAKFLTISINLKSFHFPLLNFIFIYPSPLLNPASLTSIIPPFF